jgi:hypothetical protein
MPGHDVVYMGITAATSTVSASKGGIDSTLVLAIIATIAGVVSAIGVITGGLYWHRTRRARRDREQREAEQTADIAEMGDAIVDLKTMVTSLADEMRGRAPRPQVRFSTSDGPTPAVIVRIPAVPELDAEAIVENELGAIRATRPLIERPIAAPPRSTETAGDAASGDIAGAFGAISKILQTQRRLGFGGAKYLPVTEEDYSAFEKQLERYAGEVRTFVRNWLGYLAKRRVAIAFAAQVDNDGGAPAEEARIKLHFPDPCDEAEWPERPNLPTRPKFERRLNPAYPGNRLGALNLGRAPYIPRIPDIAPINFQRDHSGPHYRNGSLEVSYDYDSLPHHDTVELDPFLVGIPESGVYTVRWTIGAKNLVHLEEGTLQVEIIYEEGDSKPVTTLGDLVKARHSSA